MPTNRQFIDELSYPNLNGYWTIVNGNLKKNYDDFDFDDYGERRFESDIF